MEVKREGGMEVKRERWRDGENSLGRITIRFGPERVNIT